MKIALSVWSVHSYFNSGEWSHADLAAFVANETKAAGIEVLTRYWKPEELESFRTALDRHQLEVAAIGASNNFSFGDPAQRAEQVREITGAVDLALTLGTRIVRVFAGDVPPDGRSYDEVKGWIVEGLREAAAYAAEKDILLCLENHGVFAGKADQVLGILQEVNSPFLRSTFDTGNFLLVNENPGEALETLHAQVAHVHFKDFVRVDENYEGRAYPSLSGERFAGRIAGEGSIDLNALITRLRHSGYNGWLTVEYEGDDEQKSGAAGSIANLDRILSTII
ncbi:sugar phosphate isomerase/epimerase [Paenibacillus ehimensis]|uniref:sugar phosphate isomerase/epimerase family protein n=1 Tax=Paenibacillus ehimensis TaxID=79264 RepID=UPI002DBBB310|nr:sugar phosphate isomerase/epimerase family protein [Paenibacillus ehimensis]MEC0207507.1 sugar phosphate isomerase/epimerase [Paenibacillus ehimensis]